MPLLKLKKKKKNSTQPKQLNTFAMTEVTGYNATNRRNKSFADAL
jgi:hypothetical protein